MTAAKKGFSILLIDDEVELSQIMAENLEANGYSTHSVQNLSDAIQAMRRMTFHAVISDLRLPDGSGGSMSSKIRELGFKDLPVIYVTGYISGTEFKALPPDEMILHKPINYKVLYHLLDQFWVEHIHNSNPYSHPSELNKDNLIGLVPPLTGDGELDGTPGSQEVAMGMRVSLTAQSLPDFKRPARLISLENKGLTVEVKPGQFSLDEAVVIEIETVNYHEKVKITLEGVIERQDAVSAQVDLFTIELADVSAGDFERLTMAVSRQQAYVLDFLKSARGF